MRSSPQPADMGSSAGAEQPRPEPEMVSEQLERWLHGDGEKTLGSLIGLFEEKSFAILFVLLLGVPALPLPTGGATHVFEIIAVLLALQLIAGARRSGCPGAGAGSSSRGTNSSASRRSDEDDPPARAHLPAAPALPVRHRLSNIVFGLLVIAGPPARSSPRRSRGSTRCPRSAWCCCRWACCSRTSSSSWSRSLVGVAGVVLEVVLGSAAVNAAGKLF